MTVIETAPERAATEGARRPARAASGGVRRRWLYAVLAAGLVLVVIPFVWMLVS